MSGASCALCRTGANCAHRHYSQRPVIAPDTPLRCCHALPHRRLSMLACLGQSSGVSGTISSDSECASFMLRVLCHDWLRCPPWHHKHYDRLEVTAQQDVHDTSMTCTIISILCRLSLDNLQQGWLQLESQDHRAQIICDSRGDAGQLQVLPPVLPQG